MGGKEISVGNVTVKPGSKGHGVLTVPDALPDGSPIEVPFVIVNGAKPGPTLYLQAGAHAFETQALGAISEVFAEVDLRELSGTLEFALPNPVAVRQRLHILLDWNAQPDVGLVRTYDGNRRWPGKAKGFYFDMALNLVWVNMIEGKADCVIDFHTRGGWGEGPNWISARLLAKELAVAYGAEYVHIGHALYDRGRPSALDYSKVTPEMVEEMRSLCRVEEQAVMRGIPSFAPEGTGGSGGFELRKEVNAIDARGIKNVMKKLGMIRGELELPKKQYIFEGVHFWDSVVTSKGGFYVSNVKFKQMVKKGDILGRIYSVRTLEEAETLIAPTDGMVFYLPEYPILSAGESPTAVLDLGRAKTVIENP